MLRCGVVLFLGAASFNVFAQDTDVTYKLSLMVNGELASSDNFVNRKPADSRFPDAVEVSFASDEITLSIEFTPPARPSTGDDKYTCNVGFQTMSGYERFNFEEASKQMPVATRTNNGVYLCLFENITSHANTAHEVSPIERGETYLFEIWVNELGKNWTYLPVTAKEDSEWSNEAMQPTANHPGD